MKYTDEDGEVWELDFYTGIYAWDGSLAIQAWCTEHDEEWGDSYEEYATVTVCLGGPLEERHTFVDVNNCKRLVDALYEEGAFFYTYRYERSGYVEYPEVVWDEEWLKANTKELEQ